MRYEDPDATHDGALRASPGCVVVVSFDGPVSLDSVSAVRLHLVTSSAPTAPPTLPRVYPESPLALALVGHVAGDTFAVAVLGGVLEVSLLAVETSAFEEIGGR